MYKYLSASIYSQRLFGRVHICTTLYCESLQTPL
uniref:Uncharacterized protein n=1 Tax=Anguilla anguilla TaxID=7936 RepID=A0A0E9QGA4_ANGAN